MTTMMPWPSVQAPAPVHTSRVSFTGVPPALNLTAPVVVSNRLSGPLGEPMEMNWGTEYRPSGGPDVDTLLRQLQNGQDADYTQRGNQVAMCVTDPVRDDAGLRSARRHVLDALGADLLLYTSKARNPVLRGVINELHPRLFAKAPMDNLSPEQFRADLQPFTDQYMPFAGSVSPAACNASAQSAVDCAHALSIYVGQQRCLDMVEAAEAERGKAYDWVVWSRGELRWVVDHPPVHLLSKDRVWIPQCSSDYFGMYDRHAAMPRALADKYLSRYRMLKSGEMLSVLQQPRRVKFYGDARFSHNSESMLHGVLEAKGVPVGRFPCAAALTCCTDCFSNGCCTASFRTADGSLQTFKAKTYGERPPEGMGSGAEGPTVWDEQGPPTSLEGFWASSQAECAGRGDEWHAAIPCEEQRNHAFVDAPGFVPEPYVSLCSDTCLRSSALQCKQRDALPQQTDFSRRSSNVTASSRGPVAAMMPQVEPPWWEPLEYFQDSSEKGPRKVRAEGVQEQEVVGMQAAATATAAEESAATDAAEYAVRMRAKDQYAHAVPAGVTCGHAILLAGMPRAGSTLQVQLVKKALQYLGVTAAPAPSFLWNLPKHLNQTREEAAALYAKEDSFWRHNTSSDSVLLYQLHEFDAEALRLCRNVTVLTQHRNLLDAYGSAVSAFGMSEDVSAAHAVGTIKLWTRDYKAWKSQNLPGGSNTLDLRYEDVVDDLDGTLRTIVRHLQTRLQIPDSRAPDPTTISAKEFARGEANLARGSTSLAAPSQDGGMLQPLSVRQAIKEARNYLAGRPEDPALLGLSWGRMH